MSKNITIMIKNYSLSTIFFVLVLSIYANANFIRDNSKEIVTDTFRHLQWQDNIEAKTVSKTWIEAINYCEDLSLDKYSDWRLPNVNELRSIIDRTKINPTIDTTFQNISYDDYWSSTTSEEYKKNAWTVGFSYGHIKDTDKYRSNSVRCVRDEQ
jgi:hypothetical protein